MAKRDDIPSMRRRTSVGRFGDAVSRLFKKDHNTNSSDGTVFHNSHKKSDRSHIKIVRAETGAKTLTLVIVSVFLVVLLLFLLVANLLSPVGFVESTENFFAGIGVSGKFPARLSASTQNNLANVSDDIALLTDANISLYNSKGGRIFSRQHGFAKPQMVTSVSRVLTYDSGSTGYRIDNRSKTVTEGNTDEAILCAALSRNGSYAITTYSSQYICETTVYSSDSEARFRWNSAEQYVTCIALSNDGKQLAVGSVGAKEGEYLSTVRVFNINSTDAVTVREFPNDLILSLSYNTDDSWGVVFENSYATVFNNKESVVHSFNGAKLSAIDLKGESDLIVLSNYNAENQNTVLVYDKNSNCTKEIMFEKNVISCCISDNYIFILSKGSLTRFDLSGDGSKEIQVASDCVFAVPSGKNAVTVSSSALSKHHFK